MQKERSKKSEEDYSGGEKLLIEHSSEIKALPPLSRQWRIIMDLSINQTRCCIVSVGCATAKGKMNLILGK